MLEAEWVHRMRRQPRQPVGRVVIFAHSGAGPNALMGIVERLPVTYDVVGVTLPGRERRFAEPPEVAPSDVVAAVRRELAALEPCPTIFFGHSLGASVAIGVALAGPSACASLLVSAQLPGGSQVERPSSWDDADLLEIMELGGATPLALLADPHWREHLFQLLRADFSLGHRLRGQLENAVLDIPLTVLGGAEDRLVPSAQLSLWKARTKAAFEMEIFPGGHFYLLDQANIDAVAAHIVAALDSAAAATDHRPRTAL
ncbi:thioesterase II family protein [Streptomyces sp. NPDC088760]|uniref:thioesterase II family protein n=1 Tax=Streptomyces sp. NPDC088760 TaxID=3365890 RepID=UPI00381A9A82